MAGPGERADAIGAAEAGQRDERGHGDDGQGGERDQAAAGEVGGGAQGRRDGRAGVGAHRGSSGRVNQSQPGGSGFSYGSQVAHVAWLAVLTGTPGLKTVEPGQVGRPVSTFEDGAAPAGPTLPLQ